MDKPMNLEKTMQWLDYRMARSNAIWFCRQIPMVFLSHKHINPITGVYEGALNSCEAKDLKKNTEEWIAKAKSAWKNLLTEQHPSALAAADLHTELATTMTDENPIGVAGVSPSGRPKCLCPECMLEEIKRTQNPELKLSL